MPLLAFSNRNSFVADLAVVFRSVLMFCHMILHLDHIERKKNIATLMTHCSEPSDSVLQQQQQGDVLAVMEQVYISVAHKLNFTVYRVHMKSLENVSSYVLQMSFNEFSCVHIHLSIFAHRELLNFIIFL